MAALAPRPAAATVPPQAVSSTPQHQADKSAAAPGNSASASSSTAAVQDESVNEARMTPQKKNSTVAESAALALAAQKAAWRQHKPHEQAHHMSTRTRKNLAAVTAAHSMDLSSDSGSSKEAA